MRHVAIPVVTKASGLVYIEPNLPVQSRYHVLTRNGIHDVRPEVEFGLLLMNLSRNPQRLPKGMNIAYAKRNPLAILTVLDDVSTKLEMVLNLPFTMKTAHESTNDNYTNTNGPDEPRKSTYWRDTIDPGHVDKNEMRKKILTKLTKHENMRTTGRLIEIPATEQRITLETGTKPIRSMPYRQGPAMRTKAEAEIRRMRDAGSNRTGYVRMGLAYRFGSDERRLYTVLYGM